MFQIFAQLIELRPIPLAGIYMDLFPPLLSPLFWERPGNIAPLVRLLQAYLCKAGKDLVQRGHLQACAAAPCICAGSAVAACDA